MSWHLFIYIKRCVVLFILNPKETQTFKQIECKPETDPDVECSERKTASAKFQKG